MAVVTVEKDVDSLSLTIVAHFDAPIERVWQLWADPRQLERWWGPPSHPATVDKHRLAVGGEVTYVMTGPGGETSRGWWRVTYVDPPTSLEFTDGYANEDGTPNEDTPTTAGAFEDLPAVSRSDGHDPRSNPGGSLVRKIKSYFFISLDGVVESPDKWHFPYFDDEMGSAVGAGFANADAMLMGRVLYEEWAAYWPEHANEPFGDVMNSMKKYVVSNSLQAAEWNNSELISGDVAKQLTDIKALDGGDITMSGSATTVRWLLREGLLDELNLLVHPIVVGDGLARLFPPDEPTIPLELLSSQTFNSGVLNLTYARAKESV
jgi:uncharacterized protein YndB with AHSA1/START domain/dihydrofolate reductase